MKTFATAGAPHLPPRTSVRQVMAEVLLALLPAIAAQAWLFGPGLLVQIAVGLLLALAIEATALHVRGQPAQAGLADLSAVVTAVLFALCIPPICPWWISAIGLLFGLGLAKHAYGGLGLNLFNPAMAAYALVLLLYPRALSLWTAPLAGLDLGQSLQAIFLGQLPASWDTMASATPLSSLRQLAGEAWRMPQIRELPLFGHYGAAGWEWIALAYAAGGSYLVWRRIVAWQVPAGVIGATILLGGLAWLADAERHPAPLQHLAGGGLMLAAWFVAADPVTGCTSPRGRLLFGAGVAALTLAIRRWGSHPDGVAFAVLLMNAAAPLIDRFTRPRVHGHAR